MGGRRDLHHFCSSSRGVTHARTLDAFPSDPEMLPGVRQREMGRWHPRCKARAACSAGQPQRNAASPGMFPFPPLPAFSAHTRVCAYTHTDTQKHMDAPRGRSGGSGREQSRQQAGRGAARQRCGEMGLAWGRERNKRPLWRASGLSLTHAGKKLIKNRA